MELVLRLVMTTISTFCFYVQFLISSAPLLVNLLSSFGLLGFTVHTLGLFRGW